MSTPPEPTGAEPTLPEPALPAAAPGRWRPLRLGLVDLFYYDAEEFRFRDGRLLLRGNNGTGKSKVLALTLPFLLDGELAARRVEPDGDPNKRMEWNLLLGGEHPHPERLGYTWIEFGRRDEADGQEHFRTLLCGLKAVAGRGIARHWFAVTDQRIGAGLSLVDATGTALGRDRLAEAVQGHGMVYDTAAAYRRAVDEALFGLGEERYKALVDLLVQLRQPQLSKRPNEAALSKALTEALPPMDQAVVADVAEAFRSLDEEREELRAAVEAERAAGGFLSHYRRYARVAARRRARLPREEHSRYERLHRDLGQARADRDEAEREQAEAAGLLAELERTAVRLAAEESALRSGPEMRSARELEQAAKDATRGETERVRAEGDRDQAARLHLRTLERLRDAEGRLDAARRDLGRDVERAREAAGRALIVDGLFTDGLFTDGPPEDEQRWAAEQSVDRRRRGIEHVAGLLDRSDAAHQHRTTARHRHDEAETEAGRAADQHARAEAGTEAEGGRHLDAVREHLGSCAELTPQDPGGVLDQLQEWVAVLTGPSPARAAADAAYRTRAAQLADAAAATGQRRRALRERRDAAGAEVARLEAGGRRGPEAPYTRTSGVRAEVEGAPLWRLVDFRPEVSETDRAGIEAALEAAGLLDAWVRPDGAVRAGHDVLVDAHGGPFAAGPTLSDVLRPAVDHGDARAAAVGSAVVERVLAAIALADGIAAFGIASEHAAATWVAPDGRFRTGTRTGSWAKPAAEYVGEGAREAARRARLGELRDELQQIAAELTAADTELDRIARARRTLDAELAALPDDAPLRTAHLRTATAAEAAREARGRSEERALEAAEAARLAAEAVVETEEAAAGLGLPADRAALDAVRQALGACELALAAVWPAVRERSAAERSATAEREESEQAAERVVELAGRAEEAALVATAAEARHSTLQATVGTTVAELERRLAANIRDRQECVRHTRRAQDARDEAGKEVARAETRIEERQRQLTDVVAAREEAVAAFQRFAATGLLAVALPSIEVPALDAGPWAATPAVTLARAIEAELGGTDDSESAWERVQRRLDEEYKSLQDALSRHGHTASARMVEDGMVVDIVYQGRPRAVPELAEALTAEVAELTRILSAHEREVLETHLLTEVAGTLQELIATAERRVAAMNEELESRPTSTGMKLRLVWRSSRKAPPGLARARASLRQSADAWSDDDRASVGAFLQEQIARQQADERGGSRLEDLTAALDYRGWHEFGIERHQHGKWVPATGPASGGERVLAVSVPLFAAASSHYATAGSPYAPRLVTLDEAFAGVDDDSRAKCLGLLHAFDLDVVMTSEREWACYPQVPGIAIAQLSRIDGVAAVLVTRWEWDGTRRTRGAEPVEAGAPAPRRGGAATVRDGLWA